jgi:hypothetical protein
MDPFRVGRDLRRQHLRIAVALLTPTLTRTHWATTPSTVPRPAQDDRLILVVVDLDHNDGSVLRRAVAAAETLAAPLSLVILHRRLGFTTDAALAASWHERLNRRHDEILDAVLALLAERGLESSLVSVERVPHARLPLGDPVGQAARTVRGVIRGRPVGWVVAPPHLNVGTGQSPHCDQVSRAAG